MSIAEQPCEKSFGNLLRSLCAWPIRVVDVGVTLVGLETCWVRFDGLQNLNVSSRKQIRRVEQINVCISCHKEHIFSGWQNL